MQRIICKEKLMQRCLGISKQIDKNKREETVLQQSRIEGTGTTSI